MARKGREFKDCTDMEELAKQLSEVMYPWVGYVDPDTIYWAEIVSDKPKNSKPVCIEKGKDWVEKISGKNCMVAVYSECWLEWDDTRRQHELVMAMAQISGMKPMPATYSFHLDGLMRIMGTDLVESDWRRANKAGCVLPDLLDEKVRAWFPRPEEYEDEEDVMDNDED